MKKVKFLVLTLVAFLSFSMSVSAVTLPELIITSHEYKVGDKVETPEFLYVDWEKTTKLYAIKAYINDLAIEGMDEGWYVSEVDLSGVTWSTSDENIVTVDQNGVITGVNAGDAFVIATYNGEKEIAPVTVLMKAQNAPGETSPKSEESKDENKGCKLETYQIVIIAVSAVLLIGLIVILVCKKKK